MAEERLTNGPVLVTGGSRGLGRAAALALGAAGHPVAVGYASRPDAAAQVVSAIEAAGGRAAAVEADLSDPEGAGRLVAAAREAVGPLFAVVNCAGAGEVRRIGEITVADFDSSMAVNARAAFLVAEACIPDMIARRSGRLIFLSSIAARVGGVISPAYAASKAAVEGLMHYYATHLLTHHVTSNAVAPAFIDTDMLAGVSLPALETLPLGRMGRPEEVASVIHMLVANAFVTGQTIHVNAGRYMT